MSEVFVDTHFWLAVLNPRDAFHEKAMQLPRPVRMVTTWAVQLEVMDALCSPSSRGLAMQFWQQTNNDSNLAVVALDDGLLNRAAIDFQTYRDKSWSMTDCISFIVMRQRGVTEVYTGDRHFEQAGFRIALT